MARTSASRTGHGVLLARLLTFARPHKALFAWTFCLLSAKLAVDLAGPWIWRRVLDGPIAIAAGRVDDAAPTETASWQVGFWSWIGAYVGLLLVGQVLAYFEVKAPVKSGQSVVRDLRRELFAHIQKLDVGFYETHRTGALVTRVTSDVNTLSELFSTGLLSMLFDLLTIAVLLAVLFSIQSRLTLYLVFFVPVLIAVSIVFRGGAHAAYLEVRSRLSTLNGYLQEVLSGVRVVQVFRREDRVSNRFRELIRPYLAANLRALLLFSLFFSAVGFVVTCMQTSVIWSGGGEIAAGTISVGRFIQYWLYLALLVRPIQELGERYNVLQSAMASAERIFEILDTRSAVECPDQPRAIPRSDGVHVRFEDVSFGYTDDQPVVSNISFDIPPGQTVALVGATGAGKSTLVQLLLRFRDPDHGRVTLNGIDLRELDPRELRTLFGLVLQEDFLFAGSVRDNLSLGREEVNEETLARALEVSGARDLVERLPSGLDHEVAERGATFSTGERQLLSIARALCGTPRIVVLDEATSSVDSETEARIERATERLLTKKSALVVAHRLSTVRRADRILVLHHGAVRESGTHDELLRENGIYARLCALELQG